MAPARFALTAITLRVRHGGGLRAVGERRDDARACRFRALLAPEAFEDVVFDVVELTA